VKIIVGLGNPGPQYRRTRHNVGFQVLDCLAARLDTAFAREKYRGLVASAHAAGQAILMVKPLTFMNNSGDCVARAARNNVDTPDNLLVVADDVNLALGRLRLRRSGSAGGHNGLKSIIERLGTDAFPRLRLGIGENRACDSLTGHVLGRFAPEEQRTVDSMIEAATDAVQRFLTEGIDATMNSLNRGTPPGREVTESDETHD